MRSVVGQPQSPEACTLSPPRVAAAYAAAMATLTCVRLASRLLLGSARQLAGPGAPEAAALPQPGSPLALPHIRTKSPPPQRNGGNNGAPGSPAPAASPRRVHPAALAAAALSDAQPAPAAPPAVLSPAGVHGVRPSPFVSTAKAGSSGGESATGEVRGGWLWGVAGSCGCAGGRAAVLLCTALCRAQPCPTPACLQDTIAAVHSGNSQGSSAPGTPQPAAAGGGAAPSGAAVSAVSG